MFFVMWGDVKFRWWPEFEKNRYRVLWYYDFRWLWFQISLTSACIAKCYSDTWNRAKEIQGMRDFQFEIIKEWERTHQMERADKKEADPMTRAAKGE
jgi:hypothetical protein